MSEGNHHGPLGVAAPPRGERRRARRARGAPEGSAWREPATAWALAAAVAGSVLAVGGVHLPVLLVVAATVLAAVLLSIGAGAGRAGIPGLRAGGGRGAQGVERLRAAAPAAVALALAGYTLLQAAPLPMAWLEAISPLNADIWARALMPLGEEAPRWASVSLDPGASVVEALRWAMYAGVFFAASAVASRRGAPFGVAVVFGSALLAAVTTLGHGLAGATKVFGLYEPRFAAAPWHVGPLLNPNNLAGYLNLGAFCGLGLFMMRRPLLPRWLVGVGVTTIVAVAVTSASRAGLGVLPIGTAIFAGLMWRRRARDDGRGAAPLRLKVLLAAALGGGVSLALVSGSDAVWLELAERNASKIDLFTSLRPMLRDHLWLGIGRGAFESVYPAYRTSVGNVVFTHAENFVLQWVCEWGLPVAALALAVLAWAFWPSRMGVTRSAVVIGGWTGAAVTLGQNLFDLALEVPAVSIALAVVLGSLAGDTARRGIPGSGQRQATRSPDRQTDARVAAAREEEPPGRAWVAAITAGGLGLMAAAAGLGWNDIDSDRRTVRALSAGSPEQAGAARGALLAALRAAMRRHPADPYFPLVGAASAWASRAGSPIPWIQRSIERSPRNGRAHLLLAEVLGERGATVQALFELRLAAEDDPDLAGQVARQAVRRTRRVEELLRAVPEGAAGAPVLAAMAGLLLRAEDREARLACAQESVARRPDGIGARWAVADALLGAIAAGEEAARCARGLRAGCGEEIEAQAREIERIDPASYFAADVRARWLLLDGRAADAEKLLEGACSRVKERVPCLKLRVRAAAAASPPSRLGAAAKDLSNAACTGPAACAEASSWLGDLMEQRGDWGAAAQHHERAVASEPTEERWLKLADAASRARAHAQAAEALERVQRMRGGHDPEIKRRIDEERARAVSNMLGR
ncbi:MAG: O-antigen ligase family protein [Polyangiaceae bacterium]|nr:O-antigen ligase family protein [Polyangiaceae bacterium]